MSEFIKPTESQSSVEISVNSKGVISYVVKVYNIDPVKATNDAVKIIEKLQEKYKKDCTF